MGAANLNAFITGMWWQATSTPTLLSNTYAPISECHECSTVCSCVDVTQ